MDAEEAWAARIAAEEVERARRAELDARDAAERIRAHAEATAAETEQMIQFCQDHTWWEFSMRFVAFKYRRGLSDDSSALTTAQWSKLYVGLALILHPDRNLGASGKGRALLFREIPARNTSENY